MSFMRITLCLFFCLQVAGFLAAADLLKAMVWETDPEANYEALDGLRVMIRGFENPDLVQMDVFQDSAAAVSFVSSYGSANRATCEAVFADRDAWFAVCEVYDRPFSSPAQLLKTLGFNRRLGTYFLSARQGACDPLLMTDGEPEDIPLQVVFEMASWTETQKRGLFVGFRAVGVNGVPRLGEKLRSFWNLSSPPVVTTTELVAVEDEPEDLLRMLDVERQNGLGDWLDALANTLP